MRARTVFVSLGVILGLGAPLSACEETTPSGAVAPGRDPCASRRGGCGEPGGPMPGPATRVYTIAVGGTVPMFAGRTAGYELTSSAPGVYRLRWTGDNMVNKTGIRRFHGSVWTPGRFARVTPGCDDGSCPLEEDDYLSPIQRVDGGERIDWDTLVAEGWDGLSFATDAEPLFFEVSVDGEAHPDLFELPARDANGAPVTPDASPFGVRSAPQG